jgi:oligopeptidase B
VGAGARRRAGAGGARLPRDSRKDGTAPLLQYGYGSYGIVDRSGLLVGVLSLLDRGFVYAIAQVRGGQELGRRWYDSGRLLNKQNTFTTSST